MAGRVGCRARGDGRRLARARARRQDRARRTRKRRFRASVARLAAVDVAPPARRRGSHAFHRAVGLRGADRLRGARGAQACDLSAGAVRPRPPSHHRSRAGAARDRAVVAGASAGAGDARSARLLARQLRRGQSRDEGPLSAPSLARRSACRRGDAPRQATLALTAASTAPTKLRSFARQRESRGHSPRFRGDERTYAGFAMTPVVFQCGWNSPATALSPMSRLRYEAPAPRPAAGLVMFPKPKPALTPNTYAYESEPLVKPTGFREYDARWLLEKDINLMGVQALGLGLGALIHELGVAPKVVTGHDFRAYSASVKTALVSGLMAAGCNVHDIGLALTPMAYFAQFDLDVPCVAMVTASHNDNGWTGVKMGAARPLTFGPDEMSRLKAIVLEGRFTPRGGGAYAFVENFPARYIADLTQRPKLKRRLKVVCACGNGTAGAFAPQVLAAVGCEVVPLDCEL